MVKPSFVVCAAAGILAACGTPSGRQSSTAAWPASSTAANPSVERVETTPDATSLAPTPEAYKRDLAQRISQTNSTKVYAGRPQALLRSVIVVKYVVDSGGNLLRSEILRSNRDNQTEATALASLKSSAPFPKPMPHLLRNGRIELSETWLFNNDGRFQLRTIALPQLDR
jgi:protein TonB